MGVVGAVKSAEEDSGKIKEPVIIVSDVHLGGKGSNYPDFWDFLDWLTSLPATGKTFTCDGDEVTIKKPGTLVLLGDILEFWDPREDDRNYVAKDALTPLSILNELDCNIIYVIGNHDEDIFEIRKIWKAKGVRFPYKGKGTFKIVFRSYPERVKGTKRVEGVKIGQKWYAFLHGHQFDKFQVFYKISRFLKVRFDPIDWHQDLANVSFAKNVGRKKRPTLIFGLLLLLYGFVYYLGRNTTIWSGFGILWVIISSFFVVTILPRFVTWLNTEIWRRNTGKIVPKCRPVKDVIEERYVPEKGKYINADVIVFGHTHYPGYYTKETNEKKRVFINTGCWVTLDKECEERGAVPNTFLYIDAKAPYLLRWDKEKVAKGEITRIEDLR